MWTAAATSAGRPREPEFETVVSRNLDDTEWTGSEMKTCCEAATLLRILLVEAAQYNELVAVSTGEKFEQLRQ